MLFNINKNSKFVKTNRFLHSFKSTFSWPADNKTSPRRFIPLEATTKSNNCASTGNLSEMQRTSALKSRFSIIHSYGLEPSFSGEYTITVALKIKLENTNILFFILFLKFFYVKQLKPKVKQTFFQVH